MEKKLLIKICVLCCLLITSITDSVFAQVGINTTSPANGALLDISSSNRGMLTPRVTLTGTDDTTTITPAATEGLLVYNTVIAGSLPIQVTPGFYYFNGVQWQRFYNRGYGVIFDQSSATVANSSSVTYTQINGLDSGFFNPPYSGTYQIKVEVNYACGDLVSTSSEGVGQASIALNMDFGGGPVIVKEKYVTSTSKRISSTTLNNLPQNLTIIYTVDLDIMQSYRFTVTGREWSRNNVGLGVFGNPTAGYPGSTGINDAQLGSLSITLLKQQ